MNNQMVSAIPTRIINPRTSFSGRRCNNHEPITPPTMPPNPSATTSVQFTIGENAKMDTAAMFMVKASTFFVAVAVLICWPANVRSANIKIPIPPPK